LESFDTIARAYRTLTTPLERKRYDRQLRAQAFTDDVEQAFDIFGERVVSPILRRGVGRGSGSGSDRGGGEKSLGSLIDTAVTAGKEGWKQMH